MIRPEVNDLDKIRIGIDFFKSALLKIPKKMYIRSLNERWIYRPDYRKIIYYQFRSDKF